MSDKPKLTDPKEFAIIRSMYFDPAEVVMKDMDDSESAERWASRIKNNKNHAK